MTRTGKRIEQEAAGWVVKTHLGTLTPEEKTNFQQWLATSSRHQGAWIRANTIQASIESVAALGAGITPEMARPRVLFQWRFPLAAAATLLLAVASILIYKGLGDRYTSGVGELRQVALTDGSTMLLNTATRAIVKMKPESRDIELDRGEALFEVAHDASRPFLVHAGDITVKAIGTAFTVKMNDAVAGEKVEVLVTQGTVEVMSPSGTARIAADHHASVQPEVPPRVEAIDRSEAERQLAWRSGRLEFDGQPLIEAVNEINRHSRKHVIVTDPVMAQRPIVGSFRAIDSESFAHIAAATLNAKVVLDGDVIRIEPK